MASLHALVLSGGEMKGAYQAGVIAGLARAGNSYDLICGTSVGSLNALFLADRMGKGQTFATAAEGLVSFWVDRVTQPGLLVSTRGAGAMALDVLRHRWNGWLDLGPLHGLILQTGISDLDVSRSPVPAVVSVTDLTTGEVGYEPASIALAMASGTVPLLMRPLPVGGRLLYDGGVRDVAPLRYPIDQGATSLTAVLCQPRDLPLAPGNLGLLPMAGRVLEILMNEIITNDLETAHRVNLSILDGVDTKGHAYVFLRVVRPLTPLHGGITTFTALDIRTMVARGLADASVPLA